MSDEMRTEARSLLTWLDSWGDGPNWSDASGATVPVVKEGLRRVLEHVVRPNLQGESLATLNDVADTQTRRLIAEAHEQARATLENYKAEMARTVAERDAKRFFANKLGDLVDVGRRLANRQPAARAATQQEADLWAKFYRLLNEAPVTIAEAVADAVPAIRKVRDDAEKLAAKKLAAISNELHETIGRELSAAYSDGANAVWRHVGVGAGLPNEAVFDEVTGLYEIRPKSSARSNSDGG